MACITLLRYFLLRSFVLRRRAQVSQATNGVVTAIPYNQTLPWRLLVIMPKEPSCSDSAPARRYAAAPQATTTHELQLHKPTSRLTAATSSRARTAP